MFIIRAHESHVPSRVCSHFSAERIHVILTNLGSKLS